MSKIKNGQFWLGDCLKLMKNIADGSVDMILCDLPYGTTACSWDTIIPFAPLWEQYDRVIKKNGAIVLTASQPFTTTLISSQIQKFKYSWVWNKISVTGFANAKHQPLRHLEDCCVFYSAFPTYNPQGLRKINKTNRNTVSVGGDTMRTNVENSKNKGAMRTQGHEYVQEFTDYPRQLLEFSRDKEKTHPTQKPVALFEYLIKTYTNEGETVLDNCAGSGTTAIAAENTGRKWICIEQDPSYYYQAVGRVIGHAIPQT